MLTTNQSHEKIAEHKNFFSHKIRNIGNYFGDLKNGQI